MKVRAESGRGAFHAWLRRATPDDIPGIAAVLREAWPQEPVQNGRLREFLAEPGNLILVAGDMEEVGGLVAAFLTLGAGDILRWEIDLLAVREASRQRGLARALLDQVVVVGAERGADLARSLVRVNNHPAERAFSRSGFRPMSSPEVLLVSRKRGESLGENPNGTHLVEVSTPFYRGIWLEGEISPHALSAGRAWLASAALDRVGALVPAEDSRTLNMARRHGYRNVGEYRWWRSEIVRMKTATPPGSRGCKENPDREEPDL